jgi:hypothetical protein
MTMTNKGHGAGDKIGAGYDYSYITQAADGRLRLWSQDCYVSEDGTIVADHDPIELTDSIDADTLREWSETFGLDAVHGDPADCIVGPGETLVGHRLTRNEELDRA